jgi:hypothetical protein
MDLRAEERANKGSKQELSEIDISEWEITCTETCPREGERSCNPHKTTQLPANETLSRTTKRAKKKERKRLRSIQEAQQLISKPKYLPPRLCYNCRQPEHLSISARNPDSRSPNSRSRTPDLLSTTTSQVLRWSRAN